MTVLYRRRSFNIAIAGTPIGNPTFNTQSTPINLGDVLLHKWIVRIPNGHAGLTGVALTFNGVTIVPFDNATVPYILGNDDRFEFAVGQEVTNGLAVAQLNEDYITHTHYLQFDYTPISASGQTAGVVATPVPVS